MLRSDCQLCNATDFVVFLLTTSISLISSYYHLYLVISRPFILTHKLNKSSKPPPPSGGKVTTPLRGGAVGHPALPRAHLPHAHHRVDYKLLASRQQIESPPLEGTASMYPNQVD